MEIIEHIHIHVLQDQADTMNLTTSEIRKCICKTKQPQKHYESWVQGIGPSLAAAS